MHNFGMYVDEGITGENSEKGAYAPYKQSQRADIYRAFVKDLLRKGLAYTFFMTSEELEALNIKSILA